MFISNAEEIINHLYVGVDGHVISNIGRSKLSYYYDAHTYGEVPFGTFSKILESAHPLEGEIFYDLGSGTGKPVMTAALLYNFSKVVGVEVIKELHESAQFVLNKFHDDYPQLDKNIQFLHDDFADIKFDDADIIFMNAANYHTEMTLPFFKKLELLKTSTRIITNSIAIDSPSFSMKNIGVLPFSWGDEPVYLHVKN